MVLQTIKSSPSSSVGRANIRLNRLVTHKKAIGRGSERYIRISHLGLTNTLKRLTVKTIL